MKGMKCGLELHVQLDTHKLFCECPSEIRKDEPESRVERVLYAVAGETGRVDAAARSEEAKGLKFIYESYDTTCLVELDEEPPHSINREALRIALRMATILHMKVVDEVHIMRKIVVDGSNTSGFQRTALIATDGFIETSQGKVRIGSLCLEEDSARIVKREKDRTFFRLDRLGIPLLEIMTEPDIRSPEQALETAEKLGRLTRTLQAKRGIGTIRQDVNVSVDGGPRVELKGFQDLKKMPSVIKKEIERQRKKKIKPEVRNVNPDGTTSFLRPMPGSARMYPETDVPSIPITKKLLDEVRKSLPEHPDAVAERLSSTLNPELAGQMLHSDKLVLFNEIAKKADPTVVASTLLSAESEIRKRFGLETEIPDHVFKDVLWLYGESKIPKSAIMEILAEYTKDPRDIMEIMQRFKQVEGPDLEKKVKKIVRSKPGLSFAAYMGLAMKEFRGKADGKLLAELIRKELSP
jgi:Glu-tRNA(Gln) amidotransferase subunit E-like FAD-binding protein